MTKNATDWNIAPIADNPSWVQEAAAWFADKWGIPAQAYEDSMQEGCQKGAAAVPQWFVVREGGDPSGPIVAGCGIIENDFHDRPDLTPNLCALLVEERWRHRGLARRLLDHARRQAADMGFDRLYLVTDHVGLYERCGWEYVGDVHEEDGGLIRMYGADVLDEDASCRVTCTEPRAEYL